MISCMAGRPNILQLQTLTNIITLYNGTATIYPANNIRVTILPTSQPIGFFLDWTNLNTVAANTTTVLESRLTTTYPKTTKELQTNPGNITLKVNIILRSVIKPVIITLFATNNGKVTDVTATTTNGAIKASLIISYNYIQTDVLYKWNILNCQLNLSNE